MDIKKLVNGIADRHDTRDPFRIAAENNIHILYEELGKNLGYFSNLFRIKTIRINNHADPFLRRSSVLMNSVMHCFIRMPALMHLIKILLLLIARLKKKRINLP